MDGRSAVAVTGVGVVSPFGIGQAALLAGLAEGRSALESFDDRASPLGTRATLGVVRAPADVPDPPGFRLSRTDRFAVIAAHEAWRAAKVPVTAAEGCPVVVGSTVAGLSDIDAAVSRDPRAYCRRGGFSRLTAYPVSHVAQAIARALGIRGVCTGLSVACASGATAIIHAARLIGQGRCSIALAGGSDALATITLAGFHALRALDPEPCRPFDCGRRGLNLGEGAGMLVLERLAEARARHATVLAILRGWAETNDAFHTTAPDEEGQGLAESVSGALQHAGVEPDAVDYVNAHGTGTPLNDVAETRGYESAFHQRSSPVPVSSTKSCMGHTLGAAGAIEAIVAILSLRAQWLPVTLRLTDPLEARAVDWLRGAVRQVPVRFAMSVSAGFGGSNASLVFERNGDGRSL